MDRPPVLNVKGIEWWQIATAAAQLGVSKGRIWHLINRGQFARHWADGLTYVLAADVERFQRARGEIAAWRRYATNPPAGL